MAASYVTDGPEQFRTAVARIVSGATVARADFQAEPVVHRWVFRRHASDVEINVLRVPPDSVEWTGASTADALARAAVRAFDAVNFRHGEGGYERLWGRPFPATELRALRKAWKQTKTVALEKARDLRCAGAVRVNCGAQGT